MGTWSTDIAKAPRGTYRVIPAGKDAKSARKVFERAEIIAASSCGVVCVSYFIPDEKRWNMFAAGQQPVAWQRYSGPRQIIDAKGKTRNVVDLPAHPTMSESWFQTFLRERNGTGSPEERQRECLDWIDAHPRAAA
jgi:hypothetical protein